MTAWSIHKAIFAGHCGVTGLKLTGQYDRTPDRHHSPALPFRHVQWIFLGLYDDHRLFSAFFKAICQGILGCATPLWPNFRPKIRQLDATVAGKVRARDTTMAGKYRSMLAS